LDIHFVKLHSCGRDYLLLDGIKHPRPAAAVGQKLVGKMTNRRNGVGACGFLLLTEGSEHAVGARQFSPRGGEVDPDPDALRCLARYAFDAGYMGSSEIVIETRTRGVELDVIDSRNIAVNLGPPLHSDKLVQMEDDLSDNLVRSLEIEGKRYIYTPLLLGGYHAAVFASGSQLQPSRLTKKIREHPLFPSLPFVEFIRVFSREEIRVRVWEPEGREIPSSGFGDGASVVASAINGFTDREVLVHNRGGDILVNWVEGGDVFVTGPVEYTFTGVYYHEEE
jgi:diaminopimelate epimerase